MKNNKITIEEKDADKLGKLFLRGRLVDENGWQYVYHQADTNAHYMGTYICWSNCDRDINDFTTTTEVQVAVNTFQFS